VYRRVHCDGGTLSVHVGTDEALFDANQTVTATERGRTVGTISIPPAEQPTLRVPLRPDGRRTCTVRFTAAEVRVPGGNDQRRLGAHYYSFDYSSK
jgi:hypothetical protein